MPSPGGSPPQMPGQSGGMSALPGMNEAIMKMLQQRSQGMPQMGGGPIGHLPMIGTLTPNPGQGLPNGMPDVGGHNMPNPLGTMFPGQMPNFNLLGRPGGMPAMPQTGNSPLGGGGQTGGNPWAMPQGNPLVGTPISNTTSTSGSDAGVNPIGNKPQSTTPPWLQASFGSRPPMAL